MGEQGAVGSGLGEDGWDGERSMAPRYMQESSWRHVDKMPQRP